MEIDDLYPSRKNYYARRLKALDKEKVISGQNKADFKAFCTALMSTGRTGQYRAGKLLSQLIFIGKCISVDLRIATLQNIQQLIAKINEMDNSDSTRADYRRTIKQFFNWFEEVDDRLVSGDLPTMLSAQKIYRYLKKSITCSYKRKKIDPNEIITDEDFKQIIEKGCLNAQERAIFSVLHETGMRTADLLLMKISSLKINSRGIGVLFTGEGKTGSRQINVIKCVPYLQEHIQLHPYKDKENNSLFYFIDSRNGQIKNFSQAIFYALVKKCVERSGIGKKSNPHWFRHSRASLDAIDGSMSEAVRKKRMGWSDDSKMIANYTHLGTKEVEEAWMRANGLEEEKEEQEKFIPCICKKMVLSSASYCYNCGRPMSLDVLEKEKERATTLQEEINEVMPLIPKEPKQRKEFLEVMKVAMSMLQNPKKLREFEKFRKD